MSFRDTILRLAREAGLPYMYQTGEVANLELVERFAELVAKAERKRICDMLRDMHAKEERHNYYGFIARMIEESS